MLDYFFPQGSKILYCWNTHNFTEQNKEEDEMLEALTKREVFPPESSDITQTYEAGKNTDHIFKLISTFFWWKKKEKKKAILKLSQVMIGIQATSRCCVFTDLKAHS